MDRLKRWLRGAFVIVGYSFDAEDEPSDGPIGRDEKDRVLVDEFHPKYAP
jgi:hypothetical protein